MPQHTNQLMADNPGTQSDITSHEEVEAALQDLLRDAQANDIDPRGAWIRRASDGQADFEIQVVELDD